MNIKWQPIVPDSFTVPVNYQVGDFIFTPLGVKDVELKLIQLFKDWLKAWLFAKINFPEKI